MAAPDGLPGLAEDEATAILESIARRELAPFLESGIRRRVLDAMQETNPYVHGLLRVRVIDNRLYVRKLLGASTRGSYWSDRQLAYVEGLLSLTEAEALPDVDFVVSLADGPPCEAQGAGPSPIFVFAKRRGCGNILAPDHSLMHDGYQRGSAGSPFFWRGLLERGLATPWRKRRPGLFWDGDFLKRSRRKIELLTPFLSNDSARAFEDPNVALDEFNQNRYGTASSHCQYRWSLSAEGNTYSMRLKNVLLCGAAAVLFTPPDDERYHEYWTTQLEEGVHYFPVKVDTPVEDFRKLLMVPWHVVRRVARVGLNFTAGLLRPSRVARYLAVLLRLYAPLQRFAPRSVHEADGAGFQLMTREVVREVRDHANDLGLQMFRLHYPDELDMLRPEFGLAEDEWNLDNVPCWGSMHRYLKCCSARNDDGGLGAAAASSALHPFCRPRALDAGTVWSRCCNTTAQGFLVLLRQSIGRVPIPDVLEILDASVLQLDLSNEELLVALDIARGLALSQASFSRARTWPLAGEGSLRKSFQEDPVEGHLAVAWFYEEMFQLACLAHHLAIEDHRSGICFRKDNFAKIQGMQWRHRLTQQQQQQQQHSEASGESLPTAGDPAPPVRSGSPLDVLLLPGAVANAAAVASLLRNARCPLRLRALVLRPLGDGAGSGRGWLGEALQRWQPWMEDVEVTWHELSDPVLAAVTNDAKHLLRPVCIQGGEVTEACAFLAARLLPHVWLPAEAQDLVSLDLSDAGRGPLVLGDLCKVREVPALLASRAALLAPRHIEHARWDQTIFASEVIFMNLTALRQMPTTEYLESFSSSLASVTAASAGEVVSAAISGWFWALHALSLPLFTPLPAAWWFVPYEPWLYDLDWASLLTDAGVRSFWLRVFQVRRYPGLEFSGTLRLFCAPSVHAVPASLLLGLSSSRQRHTYAQWWLKLIQQCSEEVIILSLRWERADVHPRIPFPLAELPWVRELVHFYGAL